MAEVTFTAERIQGTAAHECVRCTAACRGLTLSSRGLRRRIFAVPRVLIVQARSASATPSHYSVIIVPDLEKNTLGGEEFIDVHLAEPTASIQLNAAETIFEDATIRNGV